jgi:hypothetical protein
MIPFPRKEKMNVSNILLVEVRIGIIDIMTGTATDIMMIIVGEMLIFTSRIGHSIRFIVLQKMKTREEDQIDNLIEVVTDRIKVQIIIIVVMPPHQLIFRGKYEIYPRKSLLRFM